MNDSDVIIFPGTRRERIRPVGPLEPNPVTEESAWKVVELVAQHPYVEEVWLCCSEIDLVLLLNCSEVIQHRFYSRLKAIVDVSPETYGRRVRTESAAVVLTAHQLFAKAWEIIPAEHWDVLILTEDLWDEKLYFPGMFDHGVFLQTVLKEIGLIS